MKQQQKKREWFREELSDAFLVLRRVDERLVHNYLFPQPSEFIVNPHSLRQFRAILEEAAELLHGEPRGRIRRELSWWLKRRGKVHDLLDVVRRLQPQFEAALEKDNLAGLHSRTRAISFRIDELHGKLDEMMLKNTATLNITEGISRRQIDQLEAAMDRNNGPSRPRADDMGVEIRNRILELRGQLDQFNDGAPRQYRQLDQLEGKILSRIDDLKNQMDRIHANATEVVLANQLSSRALLPQNHEYTCENCHIFHSQSYRLVNLKQRKVFRKAGRHRNGHVIQQALANQAKSVLGASQPEGPAILQAEQILGTIGGTKEKVLHDSKPVTRPNVSGEPRSPQTFAPGSSSSSISAGEVQGAQVHSCGALVETALEIPLKTLDAASTSTLTTRNQFITAAVVGDVASTVGITNALTGVANSFIANKSANANRLSAEVAEAKLAFDKTEAKKKEAAEDQKTNKRPDPPDEGEAQTQSASSELQASDQPSMPATQNASNRSFSDSTARASKVASSSDQGSVPAGRSMPAAEPRVASSLVAFVPPSGPL